MVSCINEIPRTMVGGLPVGVLSRKGWAECMVTHCLETRKDKLRDTVVVFSVNGQVLAKCRWEKPFCNLVLKADALDADGQSLVHASRLLTHTPLPERVATTDFFHDAATAAEQAGLHFYFLGATEENITIAVKAIQNLYPNLKIVGYRNGYFGQQDEPTIIQTILDVKTDVLWVGLGVPRQEEFVIRNREALRGVGWVKTCGGLFDYFSPGIKRAPLWMQKMGLEWLFRTFQEPKKYFWRYFTTNGIALWLLLTRTRDV